MQDVAGYVLWRVAWRDSVVTMLSRVLRRVSSPTSPKSLRAAPRTTPPPPPPRSVSSLTPPPIPSLQSSLQVGTEISLVVIQEGHGRPFELLHPSTCTVAPVSMAWATTFRPRVGDSVRALVMPGACGAHQQLIMLLEHIPRDGLACPVDASGKNIQIL